jgi:tRNA threonylcarbamoyladenosine biosynthesis protein TsaE
MSVRSGGACDPLTMSDHPPILETRHLRWPDEQGCADFATALAARPAIRDAFIELRGPLGAGKTTFVRHLLRALGAKGRIKSPTFAVVEPYRLGDLEVSHFDFYRFDDPREFEDAGLRDAFARPGLKLAEWPERAAGALPVPDLRLTIDFSGGADDGAADEARTVVAQAFTPAGRALLA